MTNHAKHAVSWKNKKWQQGSGPLKNKWILLICILCIVTGFWIWKGAISIGIFKIEDGEETFRPEVGDPPYRVAIDAGHGGTDSGAQGIVNEAQMNMQTAEELDLWK